MRISQLSGKKFGDRRFAQRSSSLSPSSRLTLSQTFAAHGRKNPPHAERTEKRLALIRTRPRQARLCLYAGISLSLNTHAHSQAYRSDAPENRGFPDYHDRTAQTMPSSVCKPASSHYSPAVRTIAKAFCVFDASSRCFADGAAPVRLPPERF